MYIFYLIQFYFTNVIILPFCFIFPFMFPVCFPFIEDEIANRFLFIKMGQINLTSLL